LSRLGIEPAIATLGAGEGILSEVLAAASATTRPALHGQLLSELLQRNANLLCHGIVNRELLRNVSKQRNEVLCVVRPRLSLLTERTLAERILAERISLPTKAKRRLWTETRLPEFLTERCVAAIRARRPKQPQTHLLRPSRSLR
jgi:DNA polymerase III gamma/tau subunit